MDMISNFVNLLSGVTFFEWLLLILLKTDIVVQYLRLKEEQANKETIQNIQEDVSVSQDLLIRVASVVSNPKKGNK